MKTFKKLILDELKDLGRSDISSKVQSITYKSYAGGNSVRIEALDLTKEQRATLEALADTYKEGDFDGMTDMYNYRKGITLKERTAKYVFVTNNYSTTRQGNARAYLEHQWDIHDDQSAKNKMGVWYDRATHRILVEDLDLTINLKEEEATV